jgi:DNA helicase II / ATP-dependent DNA helicase PcrA
VSASPLDAFLFDDVPAYELGLNPEQLAGVRHEAGPCELVAPAGSGKTKCLVNRIARLVDRGADPARIFAVTFSRKAADEMDARLRQLGVRACCQTWHAFCLRVLKEDQTREGEWPVDEKDRAKVFVKKAMGHEGENWVGGDGAKVRRFIGHCKANLWDVDSPEAREYASRPKQFGRDASRAIRVFALSQAAVEENGLLTFDDMLVYVHRHFLLSDDARRCWAGRFDHVLQDECQDANPAQIAIAEMLSREHRNYMVIGDARQAIFGFRGSSPDSLLSFGKAWGGEKIELVRNYRSGKSIVELANAIIGPARMGAEMIAERPEPGRVEVVAAQTLDDEAREISSFVTARKDGGDAYRDVCILFRLNAQSRAIEEALLKARVPYVLIGGTNFYERKEVKDLLAYLRVALDRDVDGDAVRRCINAPFRYLGTRFVEKVMATKDGTTTNDWAHVVETAARGERIQARQLMSARDWAGIVRDVRDADLREDVASAADVLDRLVKRTNYIAWLDKEEGDESLESSHGANVRELLRVAANFDSAAALLDYVDENVRESAKQRRKGARDAVTLMSIHRSKGLEWPVVWVVGVNDQILPHVKGDDAEERRLLYVATTRARDHLVLSHVRELATRAGLKTVERSRFLDGLDHLLGTRVPDPDLPRLELEYTQEPS